MHKKDSAGHTQAATHGDPRLAPSFWARVRPSDSGCWMWTGPRDKNGYGHTCVDGDNWLAHRWIYSRVVSSSIDGLHVHHECGEPSCVRPDHLQALSPAEHRAEHGHGSWPSDPEERRAHLRSFQRTRYATDPDYRARRAENSRRYYRENREKVIAASVASVTARRAVYAEIRKWLDAEAARIGMLPLAGLAVAMAGGS